MASKKKRESKGMPVIMIIAIVVILIVGIVVGIKIKNKNDINDIKQNNESTNSENEVQSYVEEFEDGIKINKSNKLNEAKQIDGLTISNIQLATKDGMTTLLADVTNNSQAKTELKVIQITLLDQEGEELVTVTGVIESLDINATTQLNIAMTSDYVNAYDFSIKK